MLTQRRSFLQKTILMHLGMWTGLARSAANEVDVLVADDSASMRSFAAGIESFFKGHPGLRIEVTNTPSRKSVICIAVGVKAFQYALQTQSYECILAVLVPSQAYAEIVSNDKSERRRHLASIIAEPPYGVQFRVARDLMQRRITVGVFVHSSRQEVKPELTIAAQQADVGLEMLPVASGSNLARELGRFRNADALVVIPDRSLITPESFRILLEATYRRSMPVIGYTSAMCRAGAIAAPYYTSEEMYSASLVWLQSYLSGREPRSVQIKSWKLATNEAVAKSLGLSTSLGGQ